MGPMEEAVTISVKECPDLGMAQAAIHLARQMDLAVTDGSPRDVAAVVRELRPTLISCREAVRATKDEGPDRFDMFLASLGTAK